MKKSVLAVMLAVCLAVGCLPLSASAKELTASREDLQNFLVKICDGPSHFDASTASFNENGDVLKVLLEYGPMVYNDATYPGEMRQNFDPYLYSDGHLEPNPAYEKDPLGKFDASISYSKTNADKLEWIMENIFNISSDDIASMKDSLCSEDSTYCYYYDGYYYISGSFGDGPFWLSITKVVEKENLYLIISEINDWGHFYRGYSIVEPKNIDGTVYWTLHYNTKVSVDEMPALPYGFEADADTALSCGENLTWVLDTEGTLAISGTGDMEFAFGLVSDIYDVLVEDGMTSICDSAFYYCENLTSVTIPSTVLRIEPWAFSDCDKLEDIYYGGTEEQWNKVEIGEYNDSLLNATIHFSAQSASPTPEPEPEPTPVPASTPTDPVIVTKTGSDGTVTTVATWPDGKTSVKTQTPQGDTKLIVSNSAGEIIANILVPGDPAPGKDFDDVTSGWYKESVDKAAALGLFTGTSDTSFSPDAPMTRAMLVTVLHRLSGSVAYGVGTGSFADVPEDIWYQDAVGWAQALMITSGTGNGFSPNENITREQLVTMLYRYAQAIGVDYGNGTSIAYFSDSGDVASYAIEAMQWAVAEGFINGMGNNRLDPSGNATRAQVAAILIRFVDYLSGTPNSEQPSNTPKVQNGYYICPICKFVNEEGVACIACTYNFTQAKPEVYCPTCGGGYDVGGVVPWVNCLYCDKYFATSNEPIFTCRNCNKGGLSPEDLDPESELCWNCYDPNPEYCSECGRSSNLVHISRYGFCDECYEANHKGEFGYCEVCGEALTAVESVSYNGKRCFDCCTCYFCGKFLDEDEYITNGEFLCSSCHDRYGSLSDDFNQPNVWCPQCGYGFFTTGVGTEGFYCEQCGYRWLP